MQTYHGGLFTAFEYNLQRRRCIGYMLDELNVLQQCTDCWKTIVPETTGFSTFWQEGFYSVNCNRYKSIQICIWHKLALILILHLMSGLDKMRRASWGVKRHTRFVEWAVLLLRVTETKISSALWVTGAHCRQTKTGIHWHDNSHDRIFCILSTICPCLCACIC